jgi:hypothetical protein
MIICILKEIENEITIDCKVAELQHQDERKGTDGLSSLPEIFKTVAIKCEYTEKSSPDEKLTSDYEMLR